jgi:hypothetical protein
VPPKFLQRSPEAIPKSRRSTGARRPGLGSPLRLRTRGGAVSLSFPDPSPFGPLSLGGPMGTYQELEGHRVRLNLF